MSMYSGAYIGVGYIISSQERSDLLRNVENPDRRNEIIDCMHMFSINPEKYFFGEIIAEMEEGSAHSIESLAALPGLIDDGTFGLKYGSMLYDCGVPAEEINENWCSPNIYFVHWVDC